MAGAANDHVVIVTGAGGGLGGTMARGLLAAGRRVVAVDVAAAGARLDALAGDAAGHGAAARLVNVQGDIRVPADCAAVVARALERFGSVHALINNAGLGMETIDVRAMLEVRRFYDVPAERWQALFDTNVNGAFYMAAALAPHLVAQGWGRIVNVTTGFPTMVKKGFSPYGPSKAALEVATVVWSKDLAGTGVTVNALLPGGAADTPMVPVESEPAREKLVAPSVMVAPALWLTSRAADGVTGRRVVAKEWDPSAPLERNIARAVAAALPVASS
jgi:NAD(P)-dependent dehydrogenase (short-subunit alcohol dehydrogenase family)